MDINIDHGFSRAMDPDVALSCSFSPDVTTALSSITGHTYLCGPSCSMALEQQHGLKCLARSQTSTWPLVEAGAMDFVYCRIMDPDRAVGSNSGLQLATHAT